MNLSLVVLKTIAMMAIRFNLRAATSLQGLRKSVSLSTSKEIPLYAIADDPQTTIHHETLSIGERWKTNQLRKGYGVSQLTTVSLANPLTVVLLVLTRVLLALRRLFS